MLTEKRHEYILQELKRKGSITVNEIKEELGISESTIRRDLNSLDEEGRQFLPGCQAENGCAHHCLIPDPFHVSHLFPFHHC